MQENIRECLPRFNWGLIAASGFVFASCPKVYAQSNIVPDSTLGNEASIVNTEAELSLELITGGALRGQNLFHSFQEFNVSEGRSAYFVSTNAGITNILSRVTGNNVSEIFGTLGTSGESQPNLFLINPNGIIFGENSSLDVGASFVATTADSIEFGDRGSFSATNPESPPLLTVQPSAFLVNQINNGTITNLSKANSTVLGFAVNGASDRPIQGLQVLDNQSLLFLANQINVDGGSIIASGGTIELNAVSENGSVGLDFSRDNLSFDLPDNLSTGNIFIGNDSLISTVRVIGDAGDIKVSAGNIQVVNNSLLVSSVIQGNAGNITLKANDTLSVNNSRINSNVGTSSGNAARGNVGNIFATAKNIFLSNTAQLQAGLFSGAVGEPGIVSLGAEDTISITGANTGIFANTDPESFGDGSSVELSANSILLDEGAVLQASNSGDGRGGNIAIASDILNMDNGSFISTSTFGEGDAGNITVATGNLNANNGANISSATSPNSTGKGGDIIVTASDSIQLTGTQITPDNITESGINAQTQGTGNGGNITVTTEKLTITEGAAINANAVFDSSGNAGNIGVTTSDSIELIGGTEFTPSSISVDTSSSQNAGSLDIATNTLIVRDGAQISAATFGAGKGGSLIVNASEIKISGTAQNENISASGLFASVEQGATGNSGNLEITAQQLSITDSATVSVSSSGSGQAGNLDIKSDNLTLDRNALINAQTLTTDGGNIDLQITDLLTLDNQSNISATAGTAEAGGNGGNINIDTEFIVAFSNGSNDITANAFEGAGGNINISAESLFGIEQRSSTPANNTNDIDASSAFGLNGEISIDTPDVDPAQGLDSLPDNLVDASRLITRNCLGNTEEQQLNEFVVTGRGGLPSNPSEPLSDNTAIAPDWVSLPEKNTTALLPADISTTAYSPIVEAKGWKVKPDGTIVLVAQSELDIASLVIPWLNSYSCSN